MAEDVYQELCKTMARRGGMYPGMDIPEFYELVQELFTAEQARDGGQACSRSPEYWRWGR